MTPQKTVARLSLYRRILYVLLSQGTENVYSHQLARIASATAAQVRRDIMSLGYTGSPVHGYGVQDLIDAIGQVLDAPDGQRACLVGVGNLGRAIITYFAGRRPKLAIAAIFDNDPAKIGRVIGGCHCYAIDDMPQALQANQIDVGIVTVPADQAQSVADMLTEGGVRGILNFAPMRLRGRPDVHIEDVDITTSLEKVAYFARMGAGRKDTGQ